MTRRARVRERPLLIPLPTIHTKPHIPSPKPHTPSPKPQTPHPKPQTQNPRPRAPVPKRQIPNPKSQTPNPKPQTPNPKPQARTPKPQTPNRKPQSPNVHSSAQPFKTKPGTCTRLLRTRPLNKLDWQLIARPPLLETSMSVHNV